MQFGETGFEQTAVKVVGHGAIEAPSPKSVLALESLFPHGLDVIVVGLEELVQVRKLWLSRTVQRWLWLRREGCGARLHKSGSKTKRVPSLGNSR